VSPCFPCRNKIDAVTISAPEVHRRRKKQVHRKGHHTHVETHSNHQVSAAAGWLQGSRHATPLTNQTHTYRNYIEIETIHRRMSCCMPCVQPNGKHIQPDTKLEQLPAATHHVHAGLLHKVLQQLRQVALRTAVTSHQPHALSHKPYTCNNHTSRKASHQQSQGNSILQALTTFMPAFSTRCSSSCGRSATRQLAHHTNQTHTGTQTIHMGTPCCMPCIQPNAKP
jgi:hypothetical protein